MSPRSIRPGLAGAIRVVAAVTVVGSAVAITALSVRERDQVTSVVVTQDQPTAAVTPTSETPSETGAPASTDAAPADAGPAPAAVGSASAGAAPASAAVGSAPAGAAPAPAAAGTAPAAVPLGTGPAASVPLNTAPGANSGAVPGTAPGATDSVPLATGATGDAPAASVPLADSPFATAPVNTQPACPLGWPAPKQQGGLASLIGLAPLAGPFSSEAFALGSVYQPILRLAGPVLAEIAPVIAHYQPQIDPVITRVQGVEAVVLQAILPYYGPYRSQLIAAEGNVARQLAPILDRAYNSEIASCFVAWQGQLIDQAEGGPIRVPSLAHPGAVVELGPRP
ncbi:hypothetical protein IU500_19730 [Nocardia terpenica]|uniref:hypothetical protein n=1 Tax=Nocardia terpenica TaxID=455432 RepID=UPI0018944F19|nr:hypothetical protein [Nocardia terpenica]MBF6061931.1 hypothetical protein [Nocardia terpenica]MBF6106268.1 hypothetical protein [Nocardia terpenica]MBF6110351.1 hypothetical protein [Nocardia terpenica]MBF6120812.1 hypothetical protein [Nocardia terpenica]MBF6151687.1 hypothetical protein [Nocardia terpenica]